MAARISWSPPEGKTPPGYVVDRSRDGGRSWEPVGYPEDPFVDVEDHRDGDRYRVASMACPPNGGAVAFTEWAYA